MNKIGLYLITLFGIGNLGKMPGTIASLVTCILFLFMFVAEINIYILLIVFFILLVFSPNIIDKNIHQFKNLDPKEIVIDEFIGQSIPICLYEISHEGIKETSTVLTFYFIMFVLFRIFDITKPYPVSYYDKNFKNSFGVIMDDVVAGLYVVAVLVLYMVITT